MIKDLATQIYLFVMNATLTELEIICKFASYKQKVT